MPHLTFNDRLIVRLGHVPARRPAKAEDAYQQYEKEQIQAHRYLTPQTQRWATGRNIRHHGSPTDLEARLPLLPFRAPGARAQNGRRSSWAWARTLSCPDKAGSAATRQRQVPAPQKAPWLRTSPARRQAASSTAGRPRSGANPGRCSNTEMREPG